MTEKNKKENKRRPGGKPLDQGGKQNCSIGSSYLKDFFKLPG